MSDFRRVAHWRRSKYGTPFYVRGHSVSRDDWSRSASAAVQRQARVSLASHHVFGITSTYVNPNARCPVCGASVYFYQNTFGSRVFFDDLGPLWPKHGCTDTAASGAGKPRRLKLRVAVVERPAARSASERALIDAWLQDAQMEAAWSDAARHALSSWIPLEVLTRIKAAGQWLVIARNLQTARGKKIYFGAKRLPKAIARGAIIFYRRGHISYLDSDALEAAEHPVTRITNASDFVEAITGAAE